MLGSGRDLSSSPCNGRLRLKVSRGFQPDLQPSASRTVSIPLPNPAINRPLPRAVLTRSPHHALLGSDSHTSHELLKAWVGSQIVQPRIKAQHWPRQRPFIESLLKILEGFILFAKPGINYRLLVRRNIRKS